METLPFHHWYAEEMNWAVFPLKGKVPFAGTRGCLEATTDRKGIQEWEALYAPCNWGVATGEVSDIFVVDIDDWASWVRLVQMNGDIGEPCISITPSGGCHLWYAMPGEDIRNSTAQVAAGIDIRGTGGYVVAPPSRLPEGSYHWDGDDSPERIDPGPAPDWLLRRIWAGRTEGGKKSPYVAPTKIIEGGRNGELIRMAGACRHHGADPDEIEALLQSMNKRRCKPPLDPEEVRKIAWSTHRWEPAPQIRVGG